MYISLPTPTTYGIIDCYHQALPYAIHAMPYGGNSARGCCRYPYENLCRKFI